MMRYVCETLWRPRAQSEGISAKKLDKLMRLANHWRNKHLAVVGAPSPSWPSHWNFADAVTACSSDFNYYIVWILMWEAIDEYGVYELKQRASMEGAASSSNFPFFGLAVNPHASSAPSIREQLLPGHPGVASSIDPELDIAKVEAMVQTVQEEALFAALRAASLTQVLCDNGYLRLEAGIMKVSMTEAGYCLSRFKRPEITSIIDGLRQYGQAFEECYEQANELERRALFSPFLLVATMLTSSYSCQCLHVHRARVGLLRRRRSDDRSGATLFGPLGNSRLQHRARDGISSKRCRRVFFSVRHRISTKQRSSCLL